MDGLGVGRMADGCSDRGGDCNVDKASDKHEENSNCSSEPGFNCNLNLN